MPRTKRWSEFTALKNSLLDAKLRPDSHLGSVDVPAEGWIKTIRLALGMSAVQLAKRLRMRPQSVLDLEKREAAGSITLETLAKAAHALDCSMKVVFLPNHGLEKTIHEQAAKKARDERNRLMHTMRLEAQDDGVQGALDIEKIAESWLTTRRSRLWD